MIVLAVLLYRLFPLRFIVYFYTSNTEQDFEEQFMSDSLKVLSVLAGPHPER
jgi:hypothetical protein